MNEYHEQGKTKEKQSTNDKSKVNSYKPHIMHQTTTGNSMWKHRISKEWSSRTEYTREKQVYGRTQLHDLIALTAAARDKWQPPAPIKARLYNSGQHCIESLHVITLAEKQKEPL